MTGTVTGSWCQQNLILGPPVHGEHTHLDKLSKTHHQLSRPGKTESGEEYNHFSQVLTPGVHPDPSAGGSHDKACLEPCFLMT